MEWNILYDLNPQSGPSTLLYTPVVFYLSMPYSPSFMKEI